MTLCQSSGFLLDPRVRVKSRFVAVMGPEGSGKTSTLMKLAAWESAVGDCSVGIASVASSASTRRLRQFSQLLGCPFFDEPSPNFSEARLSDRFMNCDLVLLDTCFDTEALVCGSVEKLLVMPADLPPGEFAGWTDTYMLAGFDRLILSKMDRCRDPERIIEIVRVRRPYVAFLTYGEGIPHDIEPASLARFSDILSFQYH